MFVPIWLVLRRCEATSLGVFDLCHFALISPYSNGAAQIRVGLELADLVFQDSGWVSCASTLETAFRLFPCASCSRRSRHGSLLSVWTSKHAARPMLCATTSELKRSRGRSQKIPPSLNQSRGRKKHIILHVRKLRTCPPSRFCLIHSVKKA